MSIDDTLYTPYEGYVTELGEIDGVRTVSILNDHFTYHAFTGDDMFELSDTQNPFPKLDLGNEPSAFTFDD